MKISHRGILGIGALALVASHCGAATTTGAPQSAMDSGTPQGEGDSGTSQGGGDSSTPQGEGDSSTPRGEGDSSTPQGEGDSAPPETTGDGGSLGDSGLCEGTHGQGGAPVVPSEHRAVASTCSPSQAQPRSADGGSVSCSSDADCATRCVGHQCTNDRCSVDSDCPSGDVCVCAADSGGGNIIHVNACVPANCHVDSDCGASEYCSPSRGYCGGVSGYYCHSSHDTCVDVTTDCAGCSGNSCVYAPTVGHFVCGTNVCMG